MQKNKYSLLDLYAWFLFGIIAGSGILISGAYGYGMHFIFLHCAIFCSFVALRESKLNKKIAKNMEQKND